ncbi:hypothetical protein FRB95_011906 [Tulasnella sp. JGI-2019a]|nr:hypothetical protein FRB93_002925 [Tulasnella sp. JGI-2019a]KAG9035172.1 hypothetical protein FRB95_011906 [Tulasnella sp. JGI-2019a]
MPAQSKRGKGKRYEPGASDPVMKIGSLPPKATLHEILWAIKDVYGGPFDIKMEPVPVVTLPQSCVRILTEKQIYLRDYRLTFGMTDGPLTRAAPMYRRTGLVVPFIDKSVKKRQQERSEHLSHYIKVEKIELGVVIGVGKDGYSAEWFTKDTAFMFFDDKERTLQIEIGDHTERRKKRISIAIPNVETFSIASLDYQQFALFQLYSPPVFLVQQYREELPEWQQELETPPEWKRVAYFDEKHKRVGRYATRTVRFVLANDEDHLNDFMRLSRFPKFPALQLSHLQETANLELYAFKKMEALKALIAARDMSFDIKFQLEALHYNKILLPDEILSIAPKIRTLKKQRGQPFTAGALKHLATYIKRNCIAEQAGVAATAFDHAVEEYIATLADDMPKPVEHMIRHITFTPTSVNLEGPLPDVGNRVLRIYPDHIDNFIRVHFTEEGGHRYRYDYMVDNEAFIDTHVGGVLHNGFGLACKHFEFFGYSTSSLKDHCCWFMAPFIDDCGNEVNAETLRDSLGDFNREDLLHNPAKWGARIGQTLTATDPSVTVSHNEYEWVPDIMSPYNKKTPFTDGCGTISPDLAREIWEQQTGRRPINRPQHEIIMPKVFQIRVGPAKGVVSVDYRLQGRKILLRDSMKKFGQLDPTENLTIEIALMFHAPSQMFMNQPMITLLETLGVKPRILHVLLDEALEAIKEALKNTLATARLLNDYRLGTAFGVPNLLHLLDRYKLSSLLENDRMLRQARNYALYHVKRDLKYKANIPVPDSYTLVGVADVHDVLEEGEIYVCVHNPGEEMKWLQGEFLITRSPMMHPGDIQLARAIGRPGRPDSPYGIEPLPNCIVFACKGDRPLPNCLGGGDLDGDMYNLIDLTRIPEMKPPVFDEPASYPPGEPWVTEHIATVNDIADFFTRFMMSDSLGLISVRHRLCADQVPLGARDERCKQLSEQHSKAVDTPKTGQPVWYNEIIRTPPYMPDWNAGENFDSTSENYYQSERALGILYRAVDVTADELRCTAVLPEPAKSTQDVVRSALGSLIGPHKITFSSADPRLISTSKLAWLLKYFCGQLDYIRVINALSTEPGNSLSEAEVFIDSIAGKTNHPRRRKELVVRMKSMSGELVREVRNRLMGKEEGLEHTKLWLLNAWNAWNVSQKEEFREMQGSASFGWTALGCALEALSKLEDKYNYQLPAEFLELLAKTTL